MLARKRMVLTNRIRRIRGRNIIKVDGSQSSRMKGMMYVLQWLS